MDVAHLEIAEERPLDGWLIASAINADARMIYL